MTARRKSRRGAEEWAEIIQRWKDSGLSAAKFAKQHDLTESSLWYWSNRRNQGTTAGGLRASQAEVKFAELRVTPGSVSSRSASPWQMTLRTPGGHVLQLENAVDADALRTILEVLASC